MGWLLRLAKAQIEAPSVAKSANFIHGRPHHNTFDGLPSGM
jgi:hypothetical protein